MTNRQLSTWFIRILVDSLNYMDKAHHCLLILTCRLHAMFTVTCVVHWHVFKRRTQKKIQENPSGCNSNWWVVCVSANYQICESRCPSKYFIPTCQLNYQGICTWIDLLGKLNIYLTLCFFTISNLYYRINVWIIWKWDAINMPKYRGGKCFYRTWS